MADVITPQDLETMRNEHQDFLVIDVLTHEMFRKQHVPGAISVPVDQLEDVIPKIAEHDRTIVVYCYDTDCHASNKAVEILNNMGYDNVVDMEVGIEGYKEAGFTAAKG